MQEPLESWRQGSGRAFHDERDEPISTGRRDADSQEARVPGATTMTPMTRHCATGALRSRFGLRPADCN
jgi:hypothetical protein